MLRERPWIILSLATTPLFGCGDKTEDGELLGQVQQAVNICNETVPANRIVDGIPAYAQCSAAQNSAIYSNNGVDTATSSGGTDWVRTQFSGGYQCTELAHRYIYFKWDVDWIPNGNAGEWCNSPPPSSSGMVQTTTPVHGDLIVFAPSSCGADSVYGHVALVDLVDIARSQVTIVEQNNAGRRSCAQSCARCFLHVVANDGAAGSGGTSGSGGSGSGGSLPATGGASPATGGTPSATGGSSSQAGGTSPGTGGTSSASGGASSATGGTSSATGGRLSSAGGTSASSGGVSPGTGGTSQATGGSPSQGGSAAVSGGSPANGGTATTSGGRTAASGGTTAVGSGGTATASGGTTPASGGTASTSGGAAATGGNRAAEGGSGADLTKSGGSAAATGGAAGPGASSDLGLEQKEGGCGCSVPGNASRSSPARVLALCGLLFAGRLGGRRSATRRRA